jgi:hypothetical protein
MNDARHQQIAERAHAIWDDEGRPDGQAEAHWKRAEQEIDTDRSDIAAETDYEMQIDDASRAATETEKSDLDPPTRLKRNKS